MIRFFRRLKLRSEVLFRSKLKIAIFLIVIAFVICTCIIMPINSWRTASMYDRGITAIRGNSMEPTIKDGDILYLSSVKFERGEIVAAQCPPTNKYVTSNNTILLKRIIGLPGEVVEITKDGVLINGEPLSEDYVDNPSFTYQETNDYNEIILSDNEYFLLGDNRQSSFDSRHVGAVHQSYFVYSLTMGPNENTLAIRTQELTKLIVCVAGCVLIPIFVFLLLTRNSDSKTLRNSFKFKPDEKKPSKFKLSLPNTDNTKSSHSLKSNNKTKMTSKNKRKKNNKKKRRK